MKEETAFIANVVLKKLEEKNEAPAAAGEDAQEGSSDAVSSLQALRSRLAATVSSLDSTRVQLSTLESSLDSLSKQIDSFSLRLPSLEVEKNLAVNTRDFKKAGVVSKEMKALQTQKIELESRAQEIQSQVAALNAQLATLSETKAALNSQMGSVESEADKRQLATFLQQKIVLEWKNKQVDKLLRKNELEAQEEQGQSAAASSSSSSDPSSPAPPLSQPASFALAHHFSYLSHEQACNSVEVELLSKEIDELRKKHSWADDYLDYF